MEQIPDTSPSNVRRFDRIWAGYLGLVALFALSVWLINKADHSKPIDWNESHLTYLPSGKILKPMALDFDEAVADLFWIDGMLYFADAYLGQKSYQWMGNIIDIVTKLNPRFHYAYEFAGVVLGREKIEIPLTLQILERGITEFHMDWRLRIYASLAQLKLDSNFTKAAEYLKPITLAPDVPDYIRTLCATYLEKGGGRRVSLAFLVDRYIHSSNSINREIFVEKILKLYPENLDKKAERKNGVEKVLNEISQQPSILMVGLGIIHEFLSNNMSPQTQKIMELINK